MEVNVTENANIAKRKTRFSFNVVLATIH